MSSPLAKINIFQIIVDHVATLKDYGRPKTSKFDIFLFFIVPLLGSTLLVVLKIQLNNDLVNLLITVFSIFAGLLFNLQVLMFDVIGKVSNIENLPDTLSSQQSLHRRITILENVSMNISFEILVSILGVLFLAISTLSSNPIFQKVVSVIGFYIVILFSLTLAMVLKRVHVLLGDEVKIQKHIIQNHRSK